MEKVKRFLAAVGSIAVGVVGCYLFAAGFNALFASNFLVNMCGAASLMIGVYNACTGWLLLLTVLSGKTRLEIKRYDHRRKDDENEL